MRDPDTRWIQRYDSFERAYFLLSEALQIEKPSVLERVGLVKIFEMVFELSWKLLKDYEMTEGVDAKSPREVIKQAYQLGLIVDGHGWINILKDRNLTAHTYKDRDCSYDRAEYSRSLLSTHRHSAQCFQSKKRSSGGNRMMQYGLLEEDLFHICDAASELEEITEVILFGSRAKGTYRQGSDVDLSVKGKGVTHSTVLQLSDELNEERPLPYFFDVVDYNSLGDDPLRSHIDRVGVVLFTASQSTDKSRD